MASKQESLINLFQTTRHETIRICKPLANEDYVVQPCAEVSPPKWHLGHTSWFFEAVILKAFLSGYEVFNAHYLTLFNSYYKAAGTHTLQENRGALSRPTVAEILAYRSHIDDQIHALLSNQPLSDACLSLIETGIHHEQQHQELLYMDIKAILASNLMSPAYIEASLDAAPPAEQAWLDFPEGVVEIGAEDQGFAYDNERPNHKHYLYPFAISKSLVTNGDFLSFMEDGGYTHAEHWLSQGWDWVKRNNIQQPLYWQCIDNQWYEYTLHGLIPLDPNRPLVHISYFEANAYAKWKNHRLPTEQEFEVFLNNSHDIAENAFHPNNAQASAGQVWCWTASQYTPYPRYQAFDGLLAEYNGKFMCNQFVLRGGCTVTPHGHYRHSYRNFYLPEQRWMFSGIRLAKDVT